MAEQNPPPPPRLILERTVALLADSGGVLIAFANDPSVVHSLLDKNDLFARQEMVVRALAGPDPSPARLVRARCALGCVRDGILGTAFAKLRGWSASGPGSGRGESGESGGSGAAAQAAGQAREHPDAASTAAERLCYLGGADVLSPTSPLLAAELRQEIVEAALAALGSDDQASS